MFTKDEEMLTVTPSASYCRRCKNALKPVKVMDKIINRYTYIMCAKYQRKPHGVLWDDDECEEFEEK